jgi:formiminotetrahydrofolate cyclodeaminase
MYINQPLQHYLDDLASDKPTPGGGSASALSGAMGASLASMVARLTIGKNEYASVQQEMELLLEHTEILRQRFQQLIQEDIEVYGQLSKSFKMPRNTDEERTARSTAIQTALVEAALVPLEIAERAAVLLEYCQRIAEIGNTKVLTDIATAAVLTASAGTGASWMVRVNLQAMKDQELVSELSDRLGKALEIITECSLEIPGIVGERS